MDNFKVYKKGMMGQPSIADDQLSISKNVVGFGNNGQDFINNNTHLEIYFDEENLQVAFKPTNDSSNGFKLQKKNGRNKGKVDYLTGSFVKKIPLGRYVWESRNGLMVIKVNRLGRN